MYFGSVFILSVNLREMIPLAERMRPKNLNEFAGQQHLTGTGAVLRQALESGRIPSMILWGPPGVGKTTLAQLMAGHLDRPFYALSAIQAGVKDIREVIEQAQRRNLFERGGAVLFIDEIHRFSKSQQDALLGAVEKGIVTLIGATTENPSFEVIPALLSRCQLYVLQPLTRDALEGLLQRAIQTDAYMRSLDIALEETDALLLYAGGDARKLLNAFELVCQHTSAEGSATVITNDLVRTVIQQHLVLYDKSGEQHYDIISAFIKSIRGSDPNGALYWMARMLEGGEDITFIARRMVILAAEDVGLANPNALLMATQTMEAVRMIGMPEARIVLSQCAIYLATSNKSNSAYLAIDQALDTVRKGDAPPVPLHLRNAPTALMKNLDYGQGYRYAHDHPGHFVRQDYLPERLKGTRFYEPASNPAEWKTREKLRGDWGEDYGY
jgi:putative ATPase